MLANQLLELKSFAKLQPLKKYIKKKKQTTTKTILFNLKSFLRIFWKHYLNKNKKII